MEFLPKQLIDDLADEIITTVGYQPDIRRLFWAGINFRFKGMQPTLNVELVQLGADLEVLNRTARLSDGTIPFESWLDKAARYLKPYPAAAELVSKALDIIHTRHGLQPVIAQPVAPPAAVLGAIVKEKTIHQNDMVYYSFLESGYKAGISVCRIKITRYEGNAVCPGPDGTPAIYLGTGWLISPNLVITNHHVVNARENNEPNATGAEFALQAASAVAEFDYNAENTRGQDVASIRLEASDEALDYAILRIPDQNLRKPLQLLDERVDLEQGKSQVVNIIQHPLGYAKKVAFRNNHIYNTPHPAIRYFTDTEGGSSGSPVFNDRWQVIALHRAHRMVDNVSYMGQTTGVVNEGIQIEAIMADLRSRNAALCTEIEAFV